MSEDNSGLATVTRWNVVAIMLSAAVVGFGVLRVTNIIMGEAAFQSMVVVLFAIALWWPLRSEVRTWIVLASVVFIHAAVIYALSQFDWSAYGRADKGHLVFMILDLLLVLIVSDQIEKRTRKRSPIA